MIQSKTTSYQIFILLIISSPLMAGMPPAYEATYTITRGEKITAEQHTTLTKASNDTYLLKDTTKGTHGLASLTGFKRKEKTEFIVAAGDFMVTEHSMKQDVAFKSKLYQFSTEPNSKVITGKQKKPFTLSSELKPISSHMLPIWLSRKACSKITSMSIPVLKSKQIKNYEFKAQKAGLQLIRVDRVYPANVNKKTQIWFDSSRNCLPIKTRHQDEGDPIIETKLKSYKLSRP